MHLEWAAPTEISGEGQGRGNSGVFLMGMVEVQILDNYGNPTFPDGMAGVGFENGLRLILCQFQRLDGFRNASDALIHRQQEAGRQVSRHFHKGQFDEGRDRGLGRILNPLAGRSFNMFNTFEIALPCGK